MGEHSASDCRTDYPRTLCRSRSPAKVARDIEGGCWLHGLRGSANRRIGAALVEDLAAVQSHCVVSEAGKLVLNLIISITPFSGAGKWQFRCGNAYRFPRDGPHSQRGRQGRAGRDHHLLRESRSGRTL
jgi:hypothetical protein